MPNYTTNYSLEKPLATDLYDIGVQNSNMDKIDTELFERATDLVRLDVGVNLDTITKSGFYRLANNHPNTPTDLYYGQMLVMHGGGDTITQIATSYNKNTAYIRSGSPSDVNGSGAWSNWDRFYTTNSKPTADDVGALSTDGGTVGDLTISDQNIKPIKVVNSASTSCYTHYSDVNGALGFLGFKEANKPAIINAAGNDVNELYHTGNKPTLTDVGVIYGTTDMTAGTDALATGKVYLVYE